MRVLLDSDQIRRPCACFVVLLSTIQHRHCLLAAAPVCLQRNVAKIEANVARLEERLAHEKDKFAQYDVVLREAEQT